MNTIFWKRINWFWWTLTQAVHAATAWNFQLLGSGDQRSRSQDAEIGHRNLFRETSQELSDEFSPNLPGMYYGALCVTTTRMHKVKGQGHQKPKLEGRVQQLTGLIGLFIGPAYVRPVSCWTAFIVIHKMAAIAGRWYSTYLTTVSVLPVLLNILLDNWDILI